MSVIVFLSTYPAQLSFGPTSLQSALWACCSVFGAVAEVQMLVLPSSLTNYQKLRVSYKVWLLLGKQSLFQLREGVLIKAYSEGVSGPLKRSIFDTGVFHNHQGLKNFQPDQSFNWSIRSLMDPLDRRPFRGNTSHKPLAKSTHRRAWKRWRLYLLLPTLRNPCGLLAVFVSDAAFLSAFFNPGGKLPLYRSLRLRSR